MVKNPVKRTLVDSYNLAETDSKFDRNFVSKLANSIRSLIEISYQASTQHSKFDRNFESTIRSFDQTSYEVWSKFQCKLRMKLRTVM